VSFDLASGRVTAAASGLEIGNHSAELWVIPADGQPRAIGVMNSSSPSWVKVPLPAAAVMAAGVTIAVSVEPMGGSPTGQPTGPVILSGRMRAA
jgi:anti-sigma-K factor RskA